MRSKAAANHTRKKPTLKAAAIFTSNEKPHFTGIARIEQAQPAKMPTTARRWCKEINQQIFLFVYSTEFRTVETIARV